MTEFWKPVTCSNIIDGYQLSTLGRIRLNDSEPYEASYHSTNGYDFSMFILKPDETNGPVIPKQRLYPIDDLLAMTFIQPSVDLVGKRVKVVHIDGDLRNNEVNNLRWDEDIEEWVKINKLDPRINPRYMVSNFGNIKNTKNDTIMKFDDSKYGYSRIVINHIHLNVHRLVGSAFIENHLNERMFIINHMDGIRNNNYWKNLEWTNYKQNSEHMVIVGNSQRGVKNVRCELTVDDVILISETLLKYKGTKSISKNVFEELSPFIPSLTVDLVRHIKNKETWKWVTDQYFKKEDLLEKIRPTLTNK